MTDEERELRDTLRSRAEAVAVGQADEPGLARRLRAARRRRAQARVAVGAAAVVVVLAAAFVSRDDGTPTNVVAGPDPSSTTTFGTSTTGVVATPEDTSPTPPAPVTTSVAPGTTAPLSAPTTPPKPTTTAAPRPPLPVDALWPTRHLVKRFGTPGEAADDFARNVLFMLTPQIDPAQVDGSEARVPVRPLPNASRTTVLTLRRDAYWGWVVIGCAAPSIQIDQPVTGASVDSPLTVRGRAQAYEGHVEVLLFLDPDHSIASGFGTGGSDQMLPFEATLTFPEAAIKDASGGGPVPVLLVAREPRADDDSQGPTAATIVRLTI